MLTTAGEQATQIELAEKYFEYNGKATVNKLNRYCHSSYSASNLIAELIRRKIVSPIKIKVKGTNYYEWQLVKYDEWCLNN